MKHRLLFITLVASLTLPVFADDPPAQTEAEAPFFSPAVEAALAAYGGTEKPVLPEDGRKHIDRELSTVPGRMFMPRKIEIRKDACRLDLCNAFGDKLMSFPVCTSRNRGQKKTRDDCKTSEGTFNLYGAYISTDWTYKDTNQKCYGPFFLALNTPFYTGIGIHGTNAPGSIPGRRSHGCIRVHNENIVKLKGMVTKDILVTIFPDKVSPEPADAPEGPKPAAVKPAPKHEAEAEAETDSI